MKVQITIMHWVTLTSVWPMVGKLIICFSTGMLLLYVLWTLPRTSRRHEGTNYNHALSYLDFSVTEGWWIYHFLFYWHVIKILLENTIMDLIWWYSLAQTYLHFSVTDGWWIDNFFFNWHAILKSLMNTNWELRKLPRFSFTLTYLEFSVTNGWQVDNLFFNWHVIIILFENTILDFKGDMMIQSRICSPWLQCNRWLVSWWFLFQLACYHYTF